MLMTCQQPVKEGSVSDPTMHFSISSDERPLARETAAPASGFLKRRPTPNELFLSHFADVFYPTDQTTAGKLYPCGLLSPEPISSPLTQKMGGRQSMWSPQLPGKCPHKVRPIWVYRPWIMVLNCGDWGGSDKGGTFKGHQGGLVCRDSIDQSQCPRSPCFIHTLASVGSRITDFSAWRGSQNCLANALVISFRLSPYKTTVDVSGQNLEHEISCSISEFLQ